MSYGDYIDDCMRGIVWHRGKRIRLDKDIFEAHEYRQDKERARIEREKERIKEEVKRQLEGRAAHRPAEKYEIKPGEDKVKRVKELEDQLAEMKEKYKALKQKYEGQDE